MKYLFLCICSTIVVATGCNDSFIASPNPVPKVITNRIMFTTISVSHDFFPFSSISLADYNGNQMYQVIQSEAYLPCAPRGGKMLYLELQPMGESEVVVLKIADIHSTNNTLAIDTFSVAGTTNLREIALSPDGQAVAYAILAGGVGANTVNYIRYFDVRNKKRITIDNFPAADFAPGVSAFISQVSFSPDGQYLAIATWGRAEQLRIYNLQSGVQGNLQPKRVGVLTGPYIAWLPNGHTLVYAEAQSITGNYPVCIEESFHRYMYFFPDSSRICTMDAGGSGTAKICSDWDIAIGEIACSPDGKKLLYCRFLQEDHGGGDDDCIASDLKVRNIDDETGNTSLSIAEKKKGIRYGNPQWRPDGLSVSFTEYSVFPSFPWSITSGIRCVSLDLSKTEIAIPNAFHGYWLP